MTLDDNQLDRYARHIILKEIGGPGQKKLFKSKVLVIGAGGLGSPVLMYLAAAGVGTIGIVDDDGVSLSNLQRQIIHSSENIGQAKTLSAKEALLKINPDTKIILHQIRLTKENACGLIKDYDIVADGCDNFETRLAVNAACFKEKVPLVSAALMKFDGQLATFRPDDIGPDGNPLPCYQCLVPQAPQIDGQTCAEVGILGTIAGVMGTLQATEVIKEILGIGDSLAGKLMLYNGLDATFKTIKLPKDPACPCCSGA